MSQKLCVVILVCIACRPDAPPAPSERPPEVRAVQEAAVEEPPSAPTTPEGMVRIPPGPGPADKIRRHAIRYAFFIDKLETTVGEYQACVDAGVCTPAWDGKGSYENHCTVGKDPKLPITCVNIQQARAYCGWRGKRLLVDMEWHWAAKGEDRITPWGSTVLDCEHANTSMGREKHTGCVPGGGPWPVGTAPAGATPEGVLDMLGNVAERVETGASASFRLARLGGKSAGLSWSNHLPNDPLRFPFREGAAEGPGTDRVGIRCGADAVLEPEPPPRMAYLYDGGTAIVLDQPIAIERPFFLDTFETTVEEYTACVNSGACTPPQASTPEQQCTADTTGLAKRPVNCITHAQAEAFCEARNKRLPTAAEWQWAMQSQEMQHIYPWGMEFDFADERPNLPRCVVANAAGDPVGCGFDGPWPVVQGSLGDTFDGLHDMIGNVGEWTATVGDTQDQRLHAGRGWKAKHTDLQYRVLPNEFTPGIANTIIASAPAEQWSDQIGVRCARDAPNAIE